MVNFGGKAFSQLRKVEDKTFSEVIETFLIEDEKIIESYQSVRDGVVFTTKRIILIDVKGLVGKKREYTTIPYSKITTFSLQSAGILDRNEVLEIYVFEIGEVKFDFAVSANAKEICKMLSARIL